MIETFHDLPVVQFEIGMDVANIDPTAVAWRIDGNATDSRSRWRGEPTSKRFDQRWEALIAQPWSSSITALVIGNWSASDGTMAPTGELIEAADRLTGLAAVFIGDIGQEESEISWIEQGHISAVANAYPRLRRLWARGGDPVFVPGAYPALEELRFETGGLPAGVVRAVGESELPHLTHLELWLGADEYGGDATVEDLAGILAGLRMPALTSLGLCDSEITDQVAAAVAGAPVVAQLSTLDLSMGMLSDVGAAALLAGQPLTHLKTLNLSHHFLSEEMMKRLRDELEPAGVVVDLRHAEGADTDPEDRYIAVSE